MGGGFQVRGNKLSILNSPEACEKERIGPEVSCDANSSADDSKPSSQCWSDDRTDLLRCRELDCILPQDASSGGGRIGALGMIGTLTRSANMGRAGQIVTLALCVSLFIMGRALAAEVGAAVVVVNNVTGALGPDKPSTVLRAGIDVFQDEIVKAADDSAARVLFQDKTTLEVAPKSEIVLDKFVFDPNPALSKVALSVVSGVTRFTTGTLPKDNYSITTPGATLAVRGTILDINVDVGGGTFVYVEEGSCVLSSGGQTVTVNAGQSSFSRVGNTPSPPTNTPFPSRQLNQLFTLLQQATITTTPGGTPNFQPSPPANNPPTTTTNNCVSPTVSPSAVPNCP